MVLIVLPVFNEERVLADNVKKLYQFLKKRLNEPWQIIIASNGSTDATDPLAAKLALSLPGVKFFPLKKAGKGYAISETWKTWPADYFIFMDVDLATDLEALPALLDALKQDHAIVYGSRFAPCSRVQCPWLRKILSSGYGIVFRFLLGSKIQDPACGFKGVNAKTVKEILPAVQSQGWFFDSELILRAEKAGFSLKAIPVQWSEYRNPGRQSKVPLALIFIYLKEILRLRKSLRGSPFFL